MAKVHEAIIAVMADLGSIAKEKKNAQQGYNFRGIEDVYNTIHPILSKHGLFSVPTVLDMKREERTTKSGSNLIYTVLTILYTFFADDGSSLSLTVIGEGMDSGDKSCNKAMSVAHKYAFFQMFAIPTQDLDDPDKESFEVTGKKAAPKAQGKPTASSAPAKTAKEYMAEMEAKEADQTKFQEYVKSNQADMKKLKEWPELLTYIKAVHQTHEQAQKQAAEPAQEGGA